MKKSTGKDSRRPTARKPAPRGRTARGPAISPDEALPEYDFRAARPNPYAERYARGVAEGARVVALDADVAAVFRDDEAVNAALRALASIITRHRHEPRGRRRG